MKKTALTLAGLLMLGGLGACGDDDDPPGVSTGATTTSKADATTTTKAEGKGIERDDPGTDNTTPSQGIIELQTALKPEASSSKASGVASVRVDVNNRELCFTLGTQSLEGATGAHIHDGLEGKTGDIVVALAPPENGAVDGCIKKLEIPVATKIAGNPERYYVDVHTTDNKTPALRGQLAAKKS